ncbi:beta-1,3-N-acetylglucosaminyltransferase manic fringe-like isoform X2 [Dysidea avara]|uniref:beta-1,3-N-acetylglucosaminyltransferase manic fringe-like isoform X2 n=1 Tax=Dysidea avara TaxID=196820 RepID=UPI0033330550
MMGKIIRLSVVVGIAIIVVASTVIYFPHETQRIPSKVSKIFQVGLSTGQYAAPNHRDTITNNDNTKIIYSTNVTVTPKPQAKVIITKLNESAAKKPHPSTRKPRRGNTNTPVPVLLKMNSTHVGNRVMEPVDANYAENIFFSVKTMSKYHDIRLPFLLLTWLQAVKNKLSTLPGLKLEPVLTVSIVTDGSHNNSSVSLIQKAGFNMIVTDCPLVRAIAGICCKIGAAFAAYYQAMEQHKDDRDSYQWFCHFDDDVYVNVPQLSKLLQQYDPHQPYYLGKYPQLHRRYNMPIKATALDRLKERNLTTKLDKYRYATGATYCLSQALMMEAKPYLNGKHTYYNSCRLTSLPNSDDIPLGFVIGVLLGYNLTIIDTMCSQYDVYVNTTEQQLLNYVTISYLTSKNKTTYGHTVPLTSRFKDDPTRFMTYHCLLYPKVSWCHR